MGRSIKKMIRKHQEQFDTIIAITVVVILFSMGYWLSSRLLTREVSERQITNMKKIAVAELQMRSEEAENNNENNEKTIDWSQPIKISFKKDKIIVQTGRSFPGYRGYVTLTTDGKMTYHSETFLAIISNTVMAIVFMGIVLVGACVIYIFANELSRKRRFHTRTKE